MHDYRYGGVFVLLPQPRGFGAVYAQAAHRTMATALRQSIMEREMGALRQHVANRLGG